MPPIRRGAMFLAAFLLNITYAGKKGKHSVLMLIIDDLRSVKLPDEGGVDTLATPHIDELAQRGVRFQRCAECSHLSVERRI